MAQHCLDRRHLARGHRFCVAYLPLARLQRCGLDSHDQRVLPRHLRWCREHNEGKIQRAIPIEPSSSASHAPHRRHGQAAMVEAARGLSEGEAKMWIVACATCGEQFAPKRSDALYCSATCKQTAYRQRRLAGSRDRGEATSTELATAGHTPGKRRGVSSGQCSQALPKISSRRC